MYASALEAENAFYDAFSNGDVDAMMQVWARSAAVVCIHPAGPRLDDLEAIRHSWQLILAGQVPRRFDLRGRITFEAADVCVHTLEENISVPGTVFVAPPVLATNVYRHLQDGWYMVLHHGGVAPDALAGPASATPPRGGRERLH